MMANKRIDVEPMDEPSEVDTPEASRYSKVHSGPNSENAQTMLMLKSVMSNMESI